MKNYLRLLVFLALAAGAGAAPDPRLLANGRIIPSEGYADQPYIVKTDDGAWLCVMTTGKGVEDRVSGAVDSDPEDRTGVAASALVSHPIER